MSTIDKATHKLTCKSCNITEKRSVLDKGSSWSGSYWHEGTKFNNFKTAWKGGGNDEPSIVSAECNLCGQSPQHEKSYVGF